MNLYRVGGLQVTAQLTSIPIAGFAVAKGLTNNLNFQEGVRL